MVLQRCNLPFLLPRTLETFFTKLSMLIASLCRIAYENRYATHPLDLLMSSISLAISNLVQEKVSRNGEHAE